MAVAGAVPLRADAASNKWIVTASVTIGTLMGTIDVSIVNVAIPSIQATYGVSVTEVAWVSTSYLIALVIIMPLTGWLSSVFGRKTVYQACQILFTGASMLAGLAPSLPFLIAARALQGLGGGALGPISQAILAETFPPRERGLATGLYGLVVVLGPTVGPLLGGVLTDNYHWSWIFFINLPVGALGVFLVANFVREPAFIKAGRTAIDLVGIGLMTVGLSAMLVVLEEGNRWDWFNSPLVWGFGLTAASCLLLFVLWELYGTAAPVVDLRILSNRSYAVAWISVGILGFGLIGALFMQSLFLQSALGYTATQTGLAFMPRGLVTMFMNPISGLLYGVLGPQIMAGAGMVIVSWAMFLMSRWTLDIGPAQTLIPLMMAGLGLSLLFIPLFTAGLATVDRRRLTNAAGLLNVVLQLGASFGTAVLATMLEQGITANHARLVENATPTNPAFAAAVRQLTFLMMGRGGSDATTARRQAMAALDGMITRQAAVLSFEHVFQVIALVFLIALLFLPFLRKGPTGPPGDRPQVKA